MVLWIFLEGWGLIQYFSKPVLIKLRHTSSKINFLYLALKLIAKCKSLEWLLHCKWQNWRNTTINFILLKLGYMSCLVLQPNLASFQYVVILLSFKRNPTCHATYHSDLTQRQFLPLPISALSFHFWSLSLQYPFTAPLLQTYPILFNLATAPGKILSALHLILFEESLWFS